MHSSGGFLAILALGFLSNCVLGGGTNGLDVGVAKHSKNAEDTIPIIEIRGEGKPMTAAQIRALEEETEGKPLDIKVKYTWVPKSCPRKAKRKDFITFQYKGFLEDGKKFDQTYGNQPIRMQLGVGNIIPGLDKGLRGMCDTELRKIHVPWRLSRKKKSTTWKYIPNEEHWLVFDIEMLKVEPYSPELQFQYIDSNNDSRLTRTEVAKHIELIRKTFGKDVPNPNIDRELLAKFFIEYFDRDGDNRVSNQEYVVGIKEDEVKMKKAGKNSQKTARKRDPGIFWVLDFNGDGIVSMEELDAAPEILEGNREKLEEFTGKAREEKDEL